VQRILNLMGPNVSETCNSFGGKNVDCSCQRLETVKEAGVVAGVVRVVAGDVTFTGCVFCILLRKGYFADFCNSNGFRLL